MRFMDPLPAVIWSAEARREIPRRASGRRLILDYFATRCCGRNLSVGDLHLRWIASDEPIDQEYLPLRAPIGVQAYIQENLVAVVEAARGRSGCGAGDRSAARSLSSRMAGCGSTSSARAGLEARFDTNSSADSVLSIYGCARREAGPRASRSRSVSCFSGSELRRRERSWATIAWSMTEPPREPLSTAMLNSPMSTIRFLSA